MMLTRREMIAGSAALALSGRAAAQQDDWAKVTEAARQEGKVVIYNAAIGAGYYTEVAKAFERTYGIRVETLDVRASELRERVRAEQAAGRFLGDVEQHGAATAFRQEQEGAFAPHGGFPNLTTLRPAFKAEGMRVPGYVQAYGILINTSLVPPAEEPKGWADLADGRWKGRILSDDPRALGGGQVLFFVTVKSLGRDYQERLAQQNLVFSRDIVNDTRRIARGEYPVYVPLRLADAGDLKPLPVKAILPVEGSPYVRVDLAMLRNAPHPNAARLFINHFLSAESQLAYANGGQIPVVEGVIERVKPDMQAIAGARLLGTTAPEEQDSMLALAKQIYK
jgi:iron(III) transport system substrate-binding protein